MAKKSGQTASNFWKPAKVGEKIAGTFVRFGKGEYKGKPTYSMALNVKGTIKKVGLSAVLLSLFRPVAKGMKTGTKIAIEFTGLGGKKKGQNATKLFTATLDGKLLESEFDVPITGEQLLADFQDK